MSMAQLIDAVHAGTAAEGADRLLRSGPGEVDPETLRRVGAATARIAGRMRDEQHRVAAVLRAAGIAVEPVAVPEVAQRHEFTLRVADPAMAEAAADALADDGFERWERFRRGARRSFHRHSHRLTVARTDDVTTVIGLAWDDAARRSRWARLVRPTRGDWDMVELPSWASWGYPAVRAARLVLERTGLRRRHEVTLGPFLSTPASLLEPLLEVADPGPDDVVVDLGCGDGRLVIAAASAFGCRAVGVESSETLTRKAEASAAAAGLGSLVEIVHGDARDADLAAATVVFAFLPTDVLAELLPGLLASLPAGGRLVAHEQNRLLATTRPLPDHSEVVVSADALTVAHRWNA